MHCFGLYVIYVIKIYELQRFTRQSIEVALNNISTLNFSVCNKKSFLNAKNPMNNTCDDLCDRCNVFMWKSRAGIGCKSRRSRSCRIRGRQHHRICLSIYLDNKVDYITNSKVSQTHIQIEIQIQIQSEILSKSYIRFQFQLSRNGSERNSFAVFDAVYSPFYQCS